MTIVWCSSCNQVIRKEDVPEGEVKNEYEKCNACKQKDANKIKDEPH